MLSVRLSYKTPKKGGQMEIKIQQRASILLAVACIIVLAGCGAPKPDHLGIFLVDGRKLVELPKETTRTYKLNPTIKTKESSPKLIFYYPEIAVSAIRFGKAKYPRPELVELNIKPITQGMYELTPKSPLPPGSYAFLMKEGFSEDEICAFQVIK